MLVVGISLLTSEEILAVLVKSEVGNLDVGGVDGDLGLLSVHLLFDKFLNVNAPSTAVTFSDFAFTVLVGSTNNLDSVTIANWDRSGLIFGGELDALTPLFILVTVGDSAMRFLTPSSRSEDLTASGTSDHSVDALTSLERGVIVGEFLRPFS